MCERYQLLDRAAAAVANSVLVDVGMVADGDKTGWIDCGKLRMKGKDAGTESKKRNHKTSGL